LFYDKQLKWRHACNDEIEAIKHCGVYEEVDLPIGHKALENRWVLIRNPTDDTRLVLTLRDSRKLKV